MKRWYGRYSSMLWASLWFGVFVVAVLTMLGPSEAAGQAGPTTVADAAVTRWWELVVGVGSAAVMFFVLQTRFEEHREQYRQHVAAMEQYRLAVDAKMAQERRWIEARLAETVSREVMALIETNQRAVTARMEEKVHEVALLVQGLRKDVMHEFAAKRAQSRQEDNLDE